MEMPALLPKEFNVNRSLSNDQALFVALSQQPSQLIRFFEIACDDETWSEHHADWIMQVVEWITKQVDEDLLSFEYCLQAAQAIRPHFAVLEPMIPKDLTVFFKQGSISLNRLLPMSASTFFKQLVFKECIEKKTTFLTLPDLSYSNGIHLQAFISTGIAPTLWKSELPELMDLLRKTMSWGLIGLADQIQEVVFRYLTKANVCEMLSESLAEGWNLLKEGCNRFINTLSINLRLFSPSIERLGFEFRDFDDTVLEFFGRLKKDLTDLAFHGRVIENALFPLVVRQCPNLRLVDISATQQFSNYLNEMPENLQGLNVSQCVWLSPATLRQLAMICPHLEELILESCTQLNFIAWGELLKFKDLKKLDLAYCSGLENRDLSIILKGCGVRLKKLSLANCKKIGEEGFLELAKTGKLLISLNLSRCLVTDTALVEIIAGCRSLTTFDISYCEHVTEKGIQAVVRQARNLKEFSLTHCKISPDTLRKLKSVHPSLAIVF